MKKTSLIIACFSLSIIGSASMAQSGAGVKQSQFSNVTKSFITRTRGGTENIKVESKKNSSMNGEQRSVQIGFSISGTDGVVIDSDELMENAMQIMNNRLSNADALPMDEFDGVVDEQILGVDNIDSTSSEGYSMTGQFNGTESNMTFNTDSVEKRTAVINDGYDEEAFVESFNTETGTYYGI